MSDTARRILGEASEPTITYLRKGDEVLLRDAGDEFFANPAELPDAELLISWCGPEALQILHGVWLKNGAVPVRCTLSELDSMGGIFAQAADFYRHTEGGECTNESRSSTARRILGEKIKDIECPNCSGSGVYHTKLMNHGKKEMVDAVITCPVCHGKKTIKRDVRD